MHQDKLISRSLEIIEARLLDELNIDKISQSIFTSKFHYQRMFHKIMGDTVMNYIKRQRLSLACTELLTNKSTILEIALKYSYSSNESFSRAFKTYIGVTPQDFKRYNLNHDFPAKNDRKSDIMKNETFSKSTEGILRKLNGLVVQTRKTAEFLKNSSNDNLNINFNVLSSETNLLADNLMKSNQDICNITGNLSEFQNHYNIIKNLEDATFTANILAFNVALQVSRTVNCDEFAVFEEKQNKLAKSFSDTTAEIATSFSSFAKLIFEQAKDQGVNFLIDISKETRFLYDESLIICKQIKGLPILSQELSHIYNEMRILNDNYLAMLKTNDIENNVSQANMTLKMLDDFLMRISILHLSAKLDITRFHEDEQLTKDISLISSLSDMLTDTLNTSTDCFNQAVELFKMIEIEPFTDTSQTISNRLKSITFQSCILLFYLNSEVENASTILSEQNKFDTDEIYSDINRYINNINNLDNSDSQNTKYNLTNIANEINMVSNKLTKVGRIEEKGCTSFLFFAKQYSNLSKSVANYADFL